MGNHSQLAKRSSPTPASSKKRAIQRKPRRGVPGYLQGKLKVSRVDDTQEQEADRVADQVMAGGGLQRSSLGPGATAQEDKEPLGESLQPKLMREEEEEAAQPKLLRQPMEEEEEMLQPTLMRQEEEEEEMMPKSLLRQPLEEEEEMLQPTLMRQEEEEEEMMPKSLLRQPLEEEEEEMMPKSLLRQPLEEEEEMLQTTLMRQEEEEEEEMLQPKRGGHSVSRETEQRIESQRGGGDPLPEAVRQEMEEKFSRSFSGVRLHTDATAAELCRDVNARAFAVGNDLFFAPGEFVPQTKSGKHLLAHELAHVVQQSGGAARKVMRTGPSSGGGGAGSAATPPAGVTPITPVPEGGPYEFTKNGKRYKYIASGSPKELHLPEVRIPNFKQRHRSIHPTPLIREPGNRDTNQRNNWQSHFQSVVVQPLESKLDGARRRGGVSSPSASGSSDSASGDDTFFFKGTRNRQLMLFGTREQLLEKAVFPFWDSRQEARTFQVDHRREDQLGGEDNLENYELLDARANGSSGSRIGREINSQISTAISVLQSPYYRSILGGGARRISGNPSYIKQNYKLQFNRVRYNLGGVENGDRYWSVNQITQGRHFRTFRPLTEREVEEFGNPRRPMIYTSPNGGVGIRAPESAGGRTEVWPRVFATGPINVADETHATLPIDAYRSGQNSASVSAAYPGLMLHLSPTPGSVSGSSYKSWYINKQATLPGAQAAGSGGVFQSLRLPGMSPIRIDSLDMDPGVGFIGRGKLLPSVPLFSQADIDVVIEGSEVRLQKTFSMEEINVPRPFQVNYATITAFMGTSGLGLEGALGLGIERVGEGELSAQISTQSGLSIAGQFNFDERIFGRGTNAQVSARYENEAWTVGGSITIPEGKVPGIRTATINATYSEEAGFSACGDAELDIPGVESGTLEITQSEEQGFSIGGSFNLSADTPGIRGGSISATVREKPDGTGYAVSATGEAQPDIPGINSNLRVSYNDGAFTAEVSAQYSRGMLSGEVNAGVTNRTVGEDGNLSETAAPNSPLIVYGGGSLTVQIAPWLQGTAGVRFEPNGEIVVSGEIALPSSLEIFPRKEINKEIFSINIDIPIVGIAVAGQRIGIFATIGGGLSANAGIGPGVIDQLRLGITYNPAHEEDTHVTGDAHLRIPADAGLRLAVHGGLGVGIPIVSATAGLEVGGELGLEGAVEAGVHVDWMPSRGLEINANGSIYVQPKFKFDVSGFVKVEADLLVTTIELYEKRWNLASFEYGSDMRFGILFPIHYREGEPFDISLDDVQFQVPDVSPRQILSDLIDRIA